ncbi:Scramblase [Vigna unguiculata]|uniref:Phospholipid scramblase n=1 Tax=Vigna unguiculata TaxID=3917 RepID=A0A4D6M417_VIGUN|nr:Scramblase [Vigna unguiculata]
MSSLRPFWWITNSIYVEVDDQEVGVVHRRWHLWRRIYDLYLGKEENGFPFTNGHNRN